MGVTTSPNIVVNAATVFCIGEDLRTVVFYVIPVQDPFQAHSAIHL